MARKRAAQARPRGEKKTPIRKRKGRKPKPPERRETSYNPLLVLVMFLYMLGLIEKKTVKRFQAALYPKPKTARRHKRRRRQRKVS